MTIEDTDTTPADRPSAIAEAAQAPPPNPVNKLEDLALRPPIEKEIAGIHERLALLEQAAPVHAELAGAVEAHGAEIAEIHGLLNEIASATRARSAQRPRETPPRELPSGAVPGLELPADLQVDVSQPGTQLIDVPGSGVVEVNVRRPPPDSGATVIRDGKPVLPTKVRRN